jgi:hypothetical protein
VTNGTQHNLTVGRGHHVYCGFPHPHDTLHGVHHAGNAPPAGLDDEKAMAWRERNGCFAYRLPKVENGKNVPLYVDDPENARGRPGQRLHGSRQCDMDDGPHRQGATPAPNPDNQNLLDAPIRSRMGILVTCGWPLHVRLPQKAHPFTSHTTFQSRQNQRNILHCCAL